MLVHLSGCRDSSIEAPLMLFKNKDRNYPIHNVPYDDHGVSYRTGPKGCMDQTLMSQWVLEKRVMRKLSYERRRVLYMDNFIGHSQAVELEAACVVSKTDIRYFAPNATHLIHRCDSFIILKLRRAWNKHWEHFKFEKIINGEWSDTSGKI